MKKLLFVMMVLLAGGIIHACGDGGSGGDSRTGTVPLYVTDAFMEGFQQVTVTLNGVRLVHTGTNTVCDLLIEPQALDIANLRDVLQLLDTAACPAQPYNRVHIEFGQAVGLVDQQGTAGECLFDSYKDTGNSNQPNVLICDADGVCTIDINGGINVIAGTVDPFALDFNLKEFEVENFGGANCSATFKVEPQNSNDIDSKMQAGYKKGVTGYVSELDTEADTFRLTARNGNTFTVDYSQAMYGNQAQPGLDELLLFAGQHDLVVRVLATGIDVSGATPILALTVFVKLEGLAGSLADHTFTLVNTAKGIEILVDYTDAFDNGKIEGLLAENVWVETKLFGVDNGIYLAHEVEVEEEGAADTVD